ncbi:MAG: choice-of-anchor J domain-containing protein [Paludibacteraceae bacterium]
MRKIISICACLLAGMWISVQAACTPINVAWPLTTQESYDELSIFGNDDVWYFDSGYSCATASTYVNGTMSWLLTPAMDLRDAHAVTFAFSHAHRFAGSPENELTLWVCAEYDDPGTAVWNQLTIPSYSDQSSWKFLDNSITVPTAYVGSKTVFGFHYTSTETNRGKWEIKNVQLETMCPGGSGDTPNGRMRVCGQNMRNYYINYDNYNSTRANYDHATFAAKTAKIVKAFLKINADIYAMCEIEACPLVLTQLADSLNKYLGENRYAAVSDGIDVEWDSYDNNMKSGFLYRKDKIKPYGSNTAATTYQYYRNTMRIQGFQEISSNEKFVLSMNHFKAKTGGGDQGEEQRKTNAEHLLNALKKSLGDPDILVMGDLNCEVEEDPMIKIINAGYEEQLLRFDPEAYSHCYGGTGSLIDHALANSSMAQQVKSAQIYHICTTKCGIDNYATSYSDHDPYVVDITLGDYSGEQGLEETDSRMPKVENRKIIINGRLFILLESGEMYDITGQRVQK